MKRILEIDIGNTRAKWRVIGAGNQVLKRGYATTIEDLMTDVVGNVSEVRVAAVAQRELLQQLRRHFEDQMRVSRFFELAPQRNQAGLQNGYIEHASLGVDRWAGMLGVIRKYGGEFILIDLGTAITVDYVSSSGRHLGGYILPGIQMLRDSLNIGTAAVRSAEGGVSELCPGTSTQECVSNGIALMLVSSLKSAVEWGLGQGLSKLILTGGDASKVATYFPSGIIDVDVVLDGISIAAEERV